MLCRNFFTSAELDEVQQVLLKFHSAWIAGNDEFYRSRAVNSAYLTGNRYLDTNDRLALLRFVGSQRIAQLLTSLFSQPLAFMNTQLFFNPVNPAQTNYWHRDIQYTSMSEQQQREALGSSNVVHVRAAFMDEPGLELVPGTHLRWDTAEEAAVRLEHNGYTCHEALSTGYTVPMQRGDVLVFSANMIHRGLYGMDRLAFDMLFCDPAPELLKFAQRESLPRDEEYDQIENPGAFRLTALSKPD